jgi:preprotein translocase subunit SecD
VIIYSFFYYRALGIVTIASLAVSAAVTYACVVELGVIINFTLTLAGIAGFIVAVGITADSFVVFYERLKDEVHEGRTVRTSVERAWVRARRTILSADTVSFLAAAALYYLSIGSVRGFAFTLGLSTLLDLLVVFLFTKPVVTILVRKALFSTSRYSGLSAKALGTTTEAAAGPAPRARLAKRADGGSEQDPNVSRERDRDSAAADREGS